MTSGGVTAGDVRAASERIRGRVRRTPTIHVDPAITGRGWSGKLSIKLESLQLGGSFKVRGAFSHVLSNSCYPAGLIAASGGNHGAAVAIAGNALGIPTEIYVPENTPAAKLERLHREGATVVMIGKGYDEAAAAADQQQLRTGALRVPPFEHPFIIAGQGTAFRELTDDVGTPDSVLVAVGGGGLIAGGAAWLRDRCQLVSVEPGTCPSLSSALRAGAPVDVDNSGVAVDSLGSRRVGELCFQTVSNAITKAVLVKDGDIIEAQHTLWRELRVLAEPGGSVAFAALSSGAYIPGQGEHVALLICGGNTTPGLGWKDGATVSSSQKNVADADLATTACIEA